MDKKYQVFISSTYKDLKAEREKAINAILKLEHIPIGMELFNAGDDTQWAIIQRAIDNTDYYVLIIGFRYGSVTEDGTSYTEKEYDYAVSKGVPVLAFIKDRSLPTTDIEREKTQKSQKKLDTFIKKVESRETNYWKNPDELALNITSSLVAQIKNKPRTGWVRANFDPIAISSEIAVLSRENRELRKIVDTISTKAPDINVNILDPDYNKEVATLIYQYKSKSQETIDIIRKLYSKDEFEDEFADALAHREAEINIHYFCLGLENNGNAQANNVFMDLEFPFELIVTDDILLYHDIDFNVSSSNVVTLNIDDLLHCCNYTICKIGFIATQKGDFTVKYKIMCTEYSEPKEDSFQVIIE